MAIVLRRNIVGADTAPPVRLDRHRRRLSAVVKRHAPKARPFMVSVHRRDQIVRPTDDTMRMRASWRHSLVGADDVILITDLPLGGGAQGNAQTKQIGGAIALIALAVVAPYALGAIAPAIFVAGGFLTAAATAGIVAGGAYLVGKITQPKANPASDDPNRPLYGVSGGGNLPRPGDRIPSIYGHTWSQPDLSQPDFSIYDGDDMLLYKRHTVTLGKCQVHRIGLGAATVWTEADGVVAPFADSLGGDGVGQIGRGIGGGASGSGGGTQVEIINPGDTSSLVPGSVYSSPSVGGAELPRTGENPSRAGPFRASPVGAQTSRIQVDWSAPQGVSHGDAASTIGIQFRYAPCDDDDQPTGAWQDLYVFTVTAHTTRGYRFTGIVDVPLGDYVVDGQNTVPLVDGHINAVTWDGLRSHYPDTVVRPHVTEVALKIRSGKSLGITAFGDLWVEATRILPVWNGSAWVEQATRKAVYAFKDIMQADYGAGLADNEVDLDRVKFYASTLSEHDTFDGVIRGPVSVWEAAASALGPMRAEPARIANTWSINRDEPRDVQKHAITRRQIVRNTTAASFKIARDDGAADVIAEYAPDGDPRKRREVRVTFGAESITPSRVQLVGVTSHEHAHHIATWKASAAYFRRERRRITLDRRGRILARGDTARIDAWYMTSARAAGILARAGLDVTLDAPVEVGDATYATLRDRKGREWGPVKVTSGATPTRAITLDAGDVAAIEAELVLDLDDAAARDDQEMTSLLVGPLAELQDAYLIDSVQPQGRDRVAIEALFDHPGVWEALGETIPPAPPIPSIGDIAEAAVAELPWVRARCVQKGVALVMEWSVGRARGAASNVVQLSYDDGATWEAVSNDLSTSGSYPLRHVEGAAVKVGAYAVNRFGVPGPTKYDEFTTFKPAVNPDTADIDVALAGIPAELRAAIARVTGRMADLEDYIGRVVGRVDVEAQRKLIEKSANISVVKNDVTTVQNDVAGVGESLVTLSNNFEAFSGPDGTFAQYQLTLAARFGANEGRIGTVETIVVGPDSVLSILSTRVEAGLGDNSGSLASLEETYTAFAGPGGSYAVRQSVIDSRFGDNEANITETAETVTSVDGRVGALWGLKVETDLHGRKVAASIKAGADGVESFIYMKANEFAFVLDGYDDAVALVLGSIDGVPTLGWSGNTMLDGEVYITKTAHMADAVVRTAKIHDADILNAKIGAAEVSDLKIAGAAVTVPDGGANASTLNGNAGTPVDVVTVVLTFTNTVNGSRIPIFFGAQIAFHNTTGSSTIYVYGVTVNGTQRELKTFQPPSTGTYGPFYFSGADYVTGNGGTVTATVKLQFIGPPGDDVPAGGGILNVAGHKR